MVYQEYDRSIRSDLEKLAGLTATGDTENIALVAHAIKGASANVSAKRAAELAAALERVAKEDSSADLDLPLDELRTEIEAVLAETRAALGSLPQDAQTTTGGAS